MCMGLAGIVLYSTTILHKIVCSPPDIWDACSLGLARVVCVCVCLYTWVLVCGGTSGALL